MKSRLFIVLLAVSALSGCYGISNMRLYPVQGPLAGQTPLPVFTGQFTGTYNRGDISLKVSNGEEYKSQWKRVKPAAGPAGETTTNAFLGDGMSSAWDTVYGPGFYVSHVLGSWYHGVSRVTGDRGIVFDVEFLYGEDHRQSRRGVARDSKGNIYKVVF